MGSASFGAFKLILLHTKRIIYSIRDGRNLI